MSLSKKIKTGTVVSLSSLVLTSGCMKPPPNMAELVKNPMVQLIEQNHPISVTENQIELDIVRKRNAVLINAYCQLYIITLFIIISSLKNIRFKN